MTYKQQEVLKLRHLYHIFVLSLNAETVEKETKQKMVFLNKKNTKPHFKTNFSLIKTL